MPEPRLRWTGTDETDRFHDEERGRIYWVSERPLRVPADAVEEYLEQDGWEEPPDTDSPERLSPDETESVRDARAREEQQQEQNDGNGADGVEEDGFDTIRAEPATEATDGESDTQAEPASDDEDRGGDDEFDAADFVDDDWRTVEKKIQSGDYDDHLGAIERAERSRDGSPREASVLGAIKDRRNAPLGPSDGGDDDGE